MAGPLWHRTLYDEFLALTTVGDLVAQLNELVIPLNKFLHFLNHALVLFDRLIELF